MQRSIATLSMYKVLSIGAILTISVAFSAQSPAQVVHVYGPGGPLAPIKECAAIFSTKEHVDVEVTAGPEKQWWTKAQGDADLVYGGAEYMLTQFEGEHPGFIDARTRTELYKRAVGILVRKKNPKRISGLVDLSRPGIAILDVNGAGQLGLWEDLAGRKDLIGSVQQNIAASVENSAEGIQLWNSRPDLDAWITYESWHNRLPETTDLVRLLPSERLYRGTPIALASRSHNRKEAQAFLAFLKTPEAHMIFVKWGWE